MGLGALALFAQGLKVRRRALTSQKRANKDETPPEVFLTPEVLHSLAKPRYPMLQSVIEYAFLFPRKDIIIVASLL